MKSFKFGIAEVTIHRVVMFYEGSQQFTEALISVRGEIQSFYLKNEIIDLTAREIGQVLFENPPFDRLVVAHEPIKGNKAYELKWGIQLQNNFMKRGQVL